jgi:hypothetical protein
VDSAGAGRNFSPRTCFLPLNAPIYAEYFSLIFEYLFTFYPDAAGKEGKRKEKTSKILIVLA